MTRVYTFIHRTERVALSCVIFLCMFRLAHVYSLPCRAAECDPVISLNMRDFSDSEWRRMHTNEFPEHSLRAVYEGAHQFTEQWLSNNRQQHSRALNDEPCWHRLTKMFWFLPTHFPCSFLSACLHPPVCSLFPPFETAVPHSQVARVNFEMSSALWRVRKQALQWPLLQRKKKRWVATEAVMERSQMAAAWPSVWPRRHHWLIELPVTSFNGKMSGLRSALSQFSPSTKLQPQINRAQEQSVHDPMKRSTASCCAFTQNLVSEQEKLRGLEVIPHRVQVFFLNNLVV